MTHAAFTGIGGIRGAREGSVRSCRKGPLRDAGDASPAPYAPVPMSEWVAVCRLQDIVPNTGVCALVGERQVAVFPVRIEGDAVLVQV